MLEYLRNSEGCSDSNEELPKAEGIRNILWLLFEYPESSRTAFVIGIISVITHPRLSSTAYVFFSHVSSLLGPTCRYLFI